MCTNRLELIQQAIDVRSSTYKNYQRVSITSVTSLIVVGHLSDVISLCSVFQLQKLGHLSDVVSLCGGVIQLQKVGHLTDMVSSWAI